MPAIMMLRTAITTSSSSKVNPRCDLRMSAFMPVSLICAQRGDSLQRDRRHKRARLLYAVWLRRHLHDHHVVRDRCGVQGLDVPADVIAVGLTVLAADGIAHAVAAATSCADERNISVCVQGSARFAST